MIIRRPRAFARRLLGLFGVLLALIAQLGAGISVPRYDSFAQVTAASAFCHPADATTAPPDQSPTHPADCGVCPLCLTLHSSTVTPIPVRAEFHPPSLARVAPADPPPISVAPPTLQRLPRQPRAPPLYA